MEELRIELNLKDKVGFTQANEREKDIVDI